MGVGCFEGPATLVFEMLKIFQSASSPVPPVCDAFLFSSSSLCSYTSG